jgi:hypothetical protein
VSEACPKTGCTFSTTGICLLNYEPASTCPVRLAGARGVVPQEEVDDEEAPSRADDVATGRNDAAARLAPPSLKAPVPTKTTLVPGRELGPDALGRLSRRRPVRLIGLLGAPDAGKTMALVSIYLLLCRGALEGFEYRDSESAFALDDLSKGARAWSTDGSMLEQIVPHTELSDERLPGFLHLRLHSDAVNGTVDLAFPDLPGEWTESLIDRNVHERLNFLRKAEVIWLFVDGKKLCDPAIGHDVCGRTRGLIGRLAANLGPAVPLKLVVTRADQFKDLPAEMLEPILEEAEQRRVPIAVHQIVSVDRATRSRSGEGLAKLLTGSIKAVPYLTQLPGPTTAPAGRQMTRFGRGGPR